MRKRKAVALASAGVVLLALLAAVVTLPRLTASASSASQAQSIFPELTGRYQVGKQDYDLVDSSRQEIFVSDPQAKREILLSLYYPANPASGTQPAPFLSPKELEVFSQTYKVSPSLITDHIHSHAYSGAALPNGWERYPVVLFSPGWGTNPLLYAPTLEDIASHGYVVAAIWHTYSCDFTVFPDGRVMYANKAGSDPDHYPDEQDQQVEIRERVGGAWMADARFVLDQLAQMNQDDSRFAGRLDLDHVAMFGHSFGGTVALALAAQDVRIKAASDLDGGLSFDNAVPPGLNKPMLVMRSDDPQYTDAQLARMGLTRQQYEQVLARQTAEYRSYYEQSFPSYYFRLKNAMHDTYASLEALIAPQIPDQLPSSVVGTIDGQRAVSIYDTYLEAFFDKYLRNRNEPLLWGPSERYPEVEFAVHA